MPRKRPPWWFMPTVLMGMAGAAGLVGLDDVEPKLDVAGSAEKRQAVRDVDSHRCPHWSKGSRNTLGRFGTPIGPNVTN